MNPGSPELRAEAKRWHGAVPAAWAVRRFKRLAAVREGQVDPEDGRFSDLPLFAPNHIESGTGRILDVETAMDQGAESGKYLVDAGDVLYSKIRPALRKVALAPCAGLSSADMYPIKPGPDLDARFLFYSMLGEGFFRYSVLESARVAMPKINREALGDCVLLIPELTEQRAIAEFLDRKTAAIDGLIEKKERLAEALELRERAELTHAVTRGLDPAATLKATDLPWLERVPAHWDVVELRRLVRFGTSITYGIVQAGPHVEDGVPYIKTSDMAGDRLPESGYARTSREIDASYRRSKVAAGDVVVAIRATVGKALVVPEALEGANLTQGTAKVSPGPRILTNFLWYALRSEACQQRFQSLAKGVTFREITLDMLRRFQVPLPPLSEQAEICRYVARRDAALRACRANVEASCKQLREYRQALITAAVTGQVETSRGTT